MKMAFSEHPLGTTVIALMVAAGLAAVVSIAGHVTVQPAHDEWRANLDAAQQQSAEAQARAEEEARAEAEAEAARRADERRQQARQALSRSMGGQGAVGPAASGAGATVSGGGYNPLAPGGSSGQATEADDVPRNAEFGNLPDTEGVQTVYVNCTGCHSATTFTQQRMTRDRWDYTLDWMVTNGGMAELPDDDRELVLDYLVQHFSS